MDILTDNPKEWQRIEVYNEYGSYENGEKNKKKCNILTVTDNRGKIV